MKPFPVIQLHRQVPARRPFRRPGPAILILTACLLALIPAIRAARALDPPAAAAPAAPAPVAAAQAPASSAEPPAGMVQPRYTDDGRLLVPEDYRDWVFVGASIGLSYNEAVQKEADGKTEGVAYNPGLFHQTYMQPEAYARYRATGEFPEKTILVLELYESVQKVEPNKAGFSQGARVAIEASVKDHSHVTEGWAYYNFPLKENKPAASAKAMPKGLCYSCHEQHAREDKVFTQFYPVLQEARRMREAAAAK